jgi:nucleotidyltransferase/DNA polymerase involved in DNA repair
MLLCVNVSDYPLAVVRYEDRETGDVPLIVADRFDRGHVLAVDRRAGEAGARAGQTVTQAVAASRARVAVYDAVRGRVLWEDVLDALDAVSPLVDDVRPGLAFLDMRGIDGSAQTWMVRAHAALLGFALPFRFGIGANKICARAAAYAAGDGICPAGGERALLAPLPVSLLDVDDPTRERLRLLGIERLGDLARLPHGPFVRRFGAAAADWHALARGVDRTPFVPRGHAVAIEAAMFGEGRADDEAQVIFALRVLLARIAADLERCGKRAGTLRLDLELEDGTVHGIDVPLATPTADERAMLDVMRAKLEGATFAAAIVGLRVRGLQLEEGGESQTLFVADDLDPQRIAVAIARLEAVLGERMQRARTHEAHALEERFVYERFVPPKREMFAEAALPAGAEIVPQLRLLAVREIDVRLRGGEPAYVGEPAQAVLECAGPWRVEERPSTPLRTSEAVVRDEYDVLLEDGSLYRIYRQGARWYLRGAYD